MARIDELRAARQNPNIQLMLDLIAAAEGVEHGYNTGFNNTVIESLADHPRELKRFNQTDGKKNTTTAAGRYQFIQGTWDDVASKLKLPDFGPESQDLAAIELMKRRGALDLAMAGDFNGAIAKLGSEWVSLPSGTAPQKKRSQAFVEKFLAERGAQPAGETATVQSMTAPPAWLRPVLDAQQGTAPGGVGVVPPLRDAVPATEPNAVGALMNALTTKPVTPIASPVVDEEFTAEEDDLLAQALQSDVNEARGQALAQFTGEDYTPEIPLPPQFDTAINRYLALL